LDRILVPAPAARTMAVTWSLTALLAIGDLGQCRYGPSIVERVQSPAASRRADPREMHDASPPGRDRADRFDQGRPGVAVGGQVGGVLIND
jgi:hypothetical protein